MPSEQRTGLHQQPLVTARATHFDARNSNHYRMHHINQHTRCPIVTVTTGTTTATVNYDCTSTTITATQYYKRAAGTTPFSASIVSARPSANGMAQALRISSACSCFLTSATTTSTSTIVQTVPTPVSSIYQPHLVILITNTYPPGRHIAAVSITTTKSLSRPLVLRITSCIALMLARRPVVVSLPII